ncbi:MAG: DUF998 domain-containing protein [Bacteroidota bacterium]
MYGKTIFWTGIIGVLWFVITVVLGGLQFDGYSHIHQYISESYASGTRYGVYLRYVGYVPSGLLIAFFAFLAPKAVPGSRLTRMGFWSVAVFYGLGTIIVSIFPCDMGCNPELINPSISQLIHNLVAVLIYMTVPLSLVVIGIRSKDWPQGKTISLVTLLSGLLAACFVFVLFSDPKGNYVGLYQRIIEASILLWIVCFCLYIKKNQST